MRRRMTTPITTAAAGPRMASYLLLLLFLETVSAEGPACEPWCSEPCGVLNGNVEQECGSCDLEAHRCRRGQPGFSWRERQKVARPAAQRPTFSPFAAAPAPDKPSFALAGFANTDLADTVVV